MEDGILVNVGLVVAMRTMPCPVSAGVDRSGRARGR